MNWRNGNSKYERKKTNKKLRSDTGCEENQIKWGRRGGGQRQDLVGAALKGQQVQYWAETQKNRSHLTLVWAGGQDLTNLYCLPLLQTTLLSTLTSTVQPLMTNHLIMSHPPSRQCLPWTFPFLISCQWPPCLKQSFLSNHLFFTLRVQVLKARFHCPREDGVQLPDYIVLCTLHIETFFAN